MLAVLAAGIAANSRTEAKVARNRMELARARGMAEAGVTLAIGGLMVPDPALRWRADGTIRTVEYGGGTIAITIQDEAGKIDINRAPVELIAGLLDTLDPATREAREAILNAIADQRKTVTSNAQAANVRAGSLPRRRRAVALSEAAFANISELRRFTSVTRSVFERIRPFVTIYSQNVTINPLTAPREVLTALPGVTPQAIDVYILARQAQGSGQVFGELPSLGLAAASYIGVADLGAVTITAKAQTESGITFSREAVIMLNSTLSPPFKFLEWHQSIGSDAATIAAAQ